MISGDWIRSRILLDTLPLARYEPSKGRGAIGHFVLFLLAWFFAVGLAYLLGLWILSLLLVPSRDDDSYVGTILGALSAIWLTGVFLRNFEDLKLADVGLYWNRRGWRNLWMGLASGFIAVIIAVMIPVMLGFAQFRRVEASHADLGNFVFLLAFFSLQPLGEELISRGYPFQMLIRRYGFVAAVLVTSAMFSALHLANDHVTWLSSATTFLVGVLLACAVARSGDLWLCTGLHTGWNLALPMLGDNLSGKALRMTRFEVHCNDSLWCGGGYGIESSLPCLFAYLLLFVVIWLLPIEAQREEVLPAREGIW